MDDTHVRELKNFTIESLPDLDTVVLAALELFGRERLPELELDVYKRPMVVGSGNAEVTGRIIFEDLDAVFASESNYEEKLKNIHDIDGVVLVSASGGKHAPIIVKCSKEYGKHVTLITNNSEAQAGEELDHQHPYDEYVFPKNREPYTYNTSTYMGMILGKTKEDPEKIHSFIQESIDTLQYPDFSKFKKYFIIVPPQFSGIKRMIQVKFIELFGRQLARDVETSEYVKHATTIAPSNELFISFGEINDTWGKPENRLNVPLPDDADYGAMMAVGYYVVGQIQKQQPQYFKENIVAYTEEASKIFGHQINPIVE